MNRYCPLGCGKKPGAVALAANAAIYTKGWGCIRNSKRGFWGVILKHELHKTHITWQFFLIAHAAHMETMAF